jgi:hypothetical protein
MCKYKSDSIYAHLQKVSFVNVNLQNCFNIWAFMEGGFRKYAYTKVGHFHKFAYTKVDYIHI